MREVILDVETTGLDYKRGDKIIEVACVELVNHIATNNYLQFYCSTNKIIDEKSQSVHGLTNGFLNKFQTFVEQAQKLIDFIKNDTLIIHNADFDLGFINHEIKLMGLAPIENTFIDTVLLARKKLNTRIANLDYLCRRFSVDLSARKLHGALLDCNLLSKVYLELLGGQQRSLDLIKSSNNNIKSGKKDTRKKVKIHKIKISPEEIEQHKKHIESIKASLWLKLDY